MRLTEATVTFTNGETEQTKTTRRGPAVLASRARDTGRGRDEIASTIFKGRVLASLAPASPCAAAPWAAARAAPCHAIKSARSLRFVSVASVVNVAVLSAASSIPDYNFRRMKHFR